MKKQQLHAILPIALASPEIRHACLAVERVMSMIDLLDTLSPEALNEIGDVCQEYVKNHKGPLSDFKKAFIHLVVAHLSDVRLRERRLYCGITGEEPKNDRT